VFIGCRVAIPGTSIAVGEAPAIDTLSPADDATGVVLSSLSTISISFGGDVSVGTGDFEIRKTSDDSLVATFDVTGGDVTVSSTDVDIDVSGVLFEFNTGYYVLADSGVVVDTESSVPWGGISAKTVWNFTSHAWAPDREYRMTKAYWYQYDTGLTVASGKVTAWVNQFSAAAFPDLGAGTATPDYIASTGAVRLGKPGNATDQLNAPMLGTHYPDEQFIVGALCRPNAQDSADANGLTLFASDAVGDTRWSFSVTRANYELANVLVWSPTFTGQILQLLHDGTDLIAKRDGSSVDSSTETLAATGVSQIRFGGNFDADDETDLFELIGYHTELFAGARPLVEADMLAYQQATLATIEAVTFARHSTIPADDATNIDPAGTYVIVCNDRAVAGTGNYYFKRTSDDATIQTIAAASATYNGSHIELALSGLADNVEYYANYDAGVAEDPEGNGIAAETSKTALSLTTGDYTAPAIVSVTPNDNATNVDPTSQVDLQFSENIAAGSGNVYVKRTSDDATIQTVAAGSLSISTDTASFTLSGLADSVEYYLTWDDGVLTDTSANLNPCAAQASSTAYSFTTGDYTAPAINTLDPADNATDIAVDYTFRLTFNENVNAGTGDIEIRRTSDDALIEAFDVTADVTMGANYVEFTPTSDLDGNTEYYVLVDAGAIVDTSANANPFAGITSTTAWSVTTVPGYPQVAEQAAYDLDDDGLSDHLVPIPATNAGDRVIVIFVADGSTSVTIDDATFTTNILANVNAGSGTPNALVTYKDFPSGASGHTVNFGTSASQEAAAIVIRLTAGTFHAAAPEIASASGASGAPDHPNLTPSWGSASTLWLTAHGSDGSYTILAYPTDYSDGITANTSATGGCTVSAARRELEASSENPGVTSVNGNDDWAAFTIAVRPA